MSELKRLTTEDPQGNIDFIRNATKIINSEVYLRDFNGEGDLNLLDYCKVQYKEIWGEDIDELMGCTVGAKDFGDHMDDDSLLSMFYWLTVGHAELRQRLSEYEDTGLTPEEIKSIIAERSTLQEELDNAQPCFACAGFARNGGKCFGAGTCRVRDLAQLEGLEYKDFAHGESWRWRGVADKG